MEVGIVQEPFFPFPLSCSFLDTLTSTLCYFRSYPRASSTLRPFHTPSLNLKPILPRDIARHETHTRSHILCLPLRLFFCNSMEFKFRAVDDRQPLYPSPSSSPSYFTDQASITGLSTTDRQPSQEQMRNPNDVREAIQRELEKERIREEIIVKEIARQRVLEEEVRREVMVEREIAMRRLTAEGLSPEELLMKERIREEIIAAEIARRRVLEAEVRRELMVEREMAMRRHTATYPSDGRAIPVDGSGFDIPSEINKAKPEPNLSGAKKKGPKKEWSCALCQISTTSKRCLREHLQGKKHKARETGRA
ncbi:hypothetical protein I3842_16G104800 [Carya illinoinensis]|uniref:C2H2-type domain-containing protein n=1 Tax=Carya illinoinensis TaxID=32201 RepID=A0A922A3P1_CARIL|nr:hypothetical protein I3842_16G104800 [Carya illinoinensis]